VTTHITSLSPLQTLPHKRNPLKEQLSSTSSNNTTHYPSFRKNGVCYVENPSDTVTEKVELVLLSGVCVGERRFKREK